MRDRLDLHFHADWRRRFERLQTRAKSGRSPRFGVAKGSNPPSSAGSQRHDPHVHALNVDVVSVALAGGVVFWSGPLDENLVRHPSCVGLGEEAVDEQGGQPMNQAPSRHSR